MTVLEQPRLEQAFSKWKPERVAAIIEKLAGGKSNLKMVVQDITLTIGDKQIDLEGEVDFVMQKNGATSFDALAMSQAEQRGNSISTSEPGKVFLSTGDLEVLRINVAGKRIDVDVEDKQFIKRVIKLRNEFAPKNPSPETEAKKKSNSPLSMIRTISDTCKKLGFTLTVSYKGHKIATMGADAKPMLLQHVTKTNALAINSVYTALEMML